MSAAQAIPDSDIPKHDNAQAIDDSCGSPTSDSGLKWDPNTAEHTAQPEHRDRRMSNEWDAAKVPPSRFQKRKGSIHATPSSRDGHVERNKVVPTPSKKWFPGFFSNKDK